MLIGFSAITKELVLACRQLDLKVNETLAALVARTILNEKEGTFYAETGSLEEADARIVVEESVKRLFHTRENAGGKKTASWGLETLQLQASYESECIEKEEISTKHLKDATALNDAITANIVAFGVPGGLVLDFEQMKDVYAKILSLVLNRCKTPEGVYQRKGSGPQYDAENNKFFEDYLKEMEKILDSVFPRYGLQRFIALAGPEKKAQLWELMNICQGIRVLNLKTTLIANGGALGEADYERDFGLYLENRWSASELTDLAERVGKEIESVTRWCKDHQACIVGDGIGKASKETCWELNYKRQMQCYLLAIQDELATVAANMEKFRAQYNDDLDFIQTKIGVGSTASKEVLYPRFDSLGRLTIWVAEELKKATQLGERFDFLLSKRDAYFPELNRHIPPATSSSSEPVDIASLPAGEEGGPVLLTPQSTPDFLSMPLDFQGFCVYSLVTYGILVPGNPTVGVVSYKGRSCVFEEGDGLAKFMADPGNFFVGVREACYKAPELIQPLRLHEDFPKCSLYGILNAQQWAFEEFEGTRKTFTDDACQTPLHFVESNIDHSYQWNEWGLRKEALRMADMRKKATMGVQTTNSTFRKEGETQTYLPVDKAINTPVEHGTGTIQKKRYVAGLRGHPNTKLNIVDFKIDL